MSIVANTEHVKDALSKLILQFQEKSQLEAFLTSFITQVQLLDNTLIDLFNSRNLDVATGAQLDQLGALVGEPRSGNTDAVYRSYIRTRILTNSSGGTPEDLLNIVASVYSGITGNTYYAGPDSDNPLPHYQLTRFGTGEIDSNVAAQIVDRATPAGVPGTLVAQATDANSFSFAKVALTNDYIYANWDTGRGIRIKLSTSNTITGLNILADSGAGSSVPTLSAAIVSNKIEVTLATLGVDGKWEFIEAQNTCALIKTAIEGLAGVETVEVEDSAYSWCGFGVDYDASGGGSEYCEARALYRDNIAGGFGYAVNEGSTLSITPHAAASEDSEGFGSVGGTGNQGGNLFRNAGELMTTRTLGDGSELAAPRLSVGNVGPAGLSETFYIGDTEYTPEALFVADDFDTATKSWPARVGGITLVPVGTGTRAYLANVPTVFGDSSPVVRFSGGTALASTETLVGDMGGRNSFIIEMLYRGDDEVGNEAIFSKIASNSLLSNGWWVNYETLAVINLADGAGTGLRTYFRTTTAVDNSTWRYLVFALDTDNNVSAIWDGGAGGSVQLTSFPGGEDTTGWANTTDPLALGSYSSAVSAKFNGDIARAGLWLTPGLNLTDTTNFFAECERRYTHLGFVPGSDI